MIPSLSNRSGFMADIQVDLPSEVKEQLPEGAQNIFLAAFKSAQEDGMSEEAARNVAWNSVKNSYEQGEDGKWQHKPDATNSRSGVQSGGN
jgi:cation transport regulator